MTFRRQSARVRQVEEPGRPSTAWTPTERRGTHGPAQLTAEPKAVARRNPHLLSMARGRACLLQVAGVCNGDRETTVACHSNLTEHEKGGHRKADECYSVWGCARCHTWLDSSYAATGAEREAAFMAAHLRQVNVWRLLVTLQTIPESDRRAAQWGAGQPQRHARGPGPPMTTARTMSFASDSAQEKICTILAALEARHMEALELATALGVSRRLIYLYLHRLENTRCIRVVDTVMRHGKPTALYGLSDARAHAAPKVQAWQMPTPEAVAAVRRRLIAQQSAKPRPAQRHAFDRMLFGEARA